MTSFRTLLGASALALVLTGCPGGGGDQDDAGNRSFSRAAFRTFFSRQDYVPAERFDEGYAYARQHKAQTFWENDPYLWVRMDEFKACVAARKRTATFTDPAGAGHTLNLFGGFTRVFRSTFLHQLNNLH